MTGEKLLEGRTALVTGASSGIGRETAVALAKNGANISIAARRKKRLKDIADGIKKSYDVRTLVVPTDVRDMKQVERMVKKTVNQFGGLDIMVNNAGITIGGTGGKVEKLTTEQYRAMMETNVDGIFFATRAALPYLRESKGNLIFIGSIAGQYPRPHNPVYAATKWWTRGFALSVAASEGRAGVSVTVINPSEVRTEFGPKKGQRQKDKFEGGEVTEPEEIAAAVVFAASQKNSTLSEIDIYRRDKLADMLGDERFRPQRRSK